MDRDIDAFGRPAAPNIGAAVQTIANVWRSPWAYTLIGCLGVALFGLSRAYPSHLPVWAPWEFSGTEFLGAAFSLFWFFRGLRRLPLEARPARWRRACFVVGVGTIYAVLQTRFDYFALHMFFLNRVQHVVMHHLGPFLIALGSGGATVKAGMPTPLRKVLDSGSLRRCLTVVQNPVVAPILFVGLICLWLVPVVHFRAMIDPRLYKIMNWSMVGDGLLFWSLVLDPRPHPPARLSFLLRAALAVGVMFPQIALGALISFAGRDLYPYYAFCGRLFPNIDAVTDQMIGGIVIWIPPAMMSVIALILALNFMRLQEEQCAPSASEAAMAEWSRRWTGR